MTPARRDTFFRPRVYTVIRSHQVQSSNKTSEHALKCQALLSERKGEYYHGELETRANCLRLWETRAWLWSLSCGTWRRYWFTHRLFPVHAGHLTHLKMSQICKEKKRNRFWGFVLPVVFARCVKIKCRRSKSETYFQVWLRACVTAPHHEPQTTQQTERTTSSELQHDTSNTEMPEPSELQRCGERKPGF